MKYAILADIHGNLEALQTILADAKAQNPTHYVCLGDVVGYNANPKECLKIIRESDTIAPGAEVVVAPLGPGGGPVAGSGPVLGLSLCYDVRFPELYRVL